MQKLDAKNNSPAISIIVAAYNAEQYIERCLKSIQRQSFSDFEAIIVNDGSSDNTGAILDSFSQNDNRFKIIHQANKGVAAARQKGIDICNGEFTIHVDSDDWIEDQMLEEMYHCAVSNDSDMVICDLVTHKKSGVEYWCQRPSSLSSQTVLGETLYHLYGSLCNKLIRKDCYSRFNLYFEKDVNVCEDQLLVLRLLANNIKISYLNKGLYHYDKTQNNESIVNSFIGPKERLRPLMKIAGEIDLSNLQSFFDNAIFNIAYDSLQLSKTECPDYPTLFRPLIKSIRRVEGVPFHSKLMVLLRIAGLDIPFKRIQRFITINRARK